MSEILFKNGSTIKVEESSDSIRGCRSKVIEPFLGDEPYMDKAMVDEVLSKFLNKEKLSDPRLDEGIYLSSTKRFKVGDRVKVVKIINDDFICGTPNSPYGYKNRCGTVVKAYDDVWGYDLEVRMDIDGQIVYWLDEELELVNKK